MQLREREGTGLSLELASLRMQATSLKKCSNQPSWLYKLLKLYKLERRLYTTSRVGDGTRPPPGDVLQKAANEVFVQVWGGDDALSLQARLGKLSTNLYLLSTEHIQPCPLGITPLVGNGALYPSLLCHSLKHVAVG